MTNRTGDRLDHNSAPARRRQQRIPHGKRVFAVLRFLPPNPDTRGDSAIVRVYRQKCGFLPDRAYPRFKGTTTPINGGLLHHLSRGGLVLV